MASWGSPPAETYREPQEGQLRMRSDSCLLPRLLRHADMHTLLKENLFLRSEEKHLALEYIHTLGSQGEMEKGKLSTRYVLQLNPIH